MRSLKQTLACLLIWCAAYAVLEPDTTVNRYATASDAAYWPSVNEGDYIFFQGNNDGGADIYAPGGDPKFLSISLPVGKKILIYAGDYERILINGASCAGTKENPTVVTNLGGQVRWGYSTDSNQYRTFDLLNFQHLHLTGRYDAAAQTGHPDFLGHDGGNALDSGDYYEKYGLWGNPRWSGPMYHGSYGNGVAIRGFDTVKVDYVSSWGGYFASFNIKTDNPTNPSEVEVDVQDCFAGFVEGEAFYISYSTKAHDQDITRLTLKNNITAFTGAEALQTDNLAEGSVIENNVCLGAATWFRHPFQARYQDNLHQLSFVEGNVTVANNLLIGANGSLHQFRYRDANSGAVTGRTSPASDKPVTMENNFYGFTRTTMGYMWQGDGITPYVFKNNVYGDISVPNADDTLSIVPEEESGFFNIGNNNNDILFEGNIYPEGRDLYYLSTNDGNNITRTGNIQNAAPIIQFENSGFPDDTDWRDITFWSPVYLNTPEDNGLDKDGEFIPYSLGDIVIFYDSSGTTKFFECVQAHAGNFDPNHSPAYWSHMTWNGRNLPPLDLRIKKDTYYNYRGMGVTYNEANETSADLIAPIITLTGADANFLQGTEYHEPGFVAIDNKDGDVSQQLTSYWVGTPYDAQTTGNYTRRYEVTDAAGNIALAVERKVSVSEANINILKEIKVNMHQLRPAEYSDWTDLGNDRAGLLNPKGSNTVTDLFDSSGAATGYVLSIDNTEDSSSEHYKTHDNGVGRTIGDFPAEITTEGIRIRDPHENPCQFVFTQLNANSYYDVYFTGYKSGVGTSLQSTLAHQASGQSVTIEIQDNQDAVGLLSNLSTDPNTNNGQLVLDFTTPTSGGQPNISGLIILEKTDVGIANAAPTIQNLNSIVTSVNETSAPITFTLQDADSDINELSVIASSLNTDKLPHENITVTGTGANRSLSVLPTGRGPMDVLLLISDGVTYVPYVLKIKAVHPSYRAWANTHFASDSNDADLEDTVWGASADHDRDKMSNLLERFWDTSPTEANPSPKPIFAVGSGAVSVRIKTAQDLAGISWTPLWSTDLEAWSEGGMTVQPAEVIDAKQAYDISIPHSTTPTKGFIKIQVTED